MIVLKYNCYSYLRGFATTSVFSVQFVMTNYSVSATSYFAAFWRLMTLSVPRMEHHYFTPAAYEVRTEFTCWKAPNLKGLMLVPPST